MKDWRGGRAASYNIIPSSTGAAKVHENLKDVEYCNHAIVFIFLVQIKGVCHSFYLPIIV